MEVKEFYQKHKDIINNNPLDNITLEKLFKDLRDQSEIVKLKKYVNRKIYDMDLSRYVSLEEIETYISRGMLIEVKESITGKDITDDILLKIAFNVQLKQKNVNRDMLYQYIKQNSTKGE